MAGATPAAATGDDPLFPDEVDPADVSPNCASGQVDDQLDFRPTRPRDPPPPSSLLSPFERRPPYNRWPITPNFWTVAGYETVGTVLRDPLLYDGQPFPDHDVPVMSAMRPEPHKRVRSAVQGMFTRRALEHLSEFVTAQATQRTTALVARGGAAS